MSLFWKIEMPRPRLNLSMGLGVFEPGFGQFGQEIGPNPKPNFRSVQYICRLKGFSCRLRDSTPMLRGKKKPFNRSPYKRGTGMARLRESGCKFVTVCVEGQSYNFYQSKSQTSQVCSFSTHIQRGRGQSITITKALFSLFSQG